MKVLWWEFWLVRCIGVCLSSSELKVMSLFIV